METIWSRRCVVPVTQDANGDYVARLPQRFLSATSAIDASSPRPAVTLSPSIAYWTDWDNHFVQISSPTIEDPDDPCVITTHFSDQN